MHISSRGLALIESFEGFCSAPYYDSYGRVWTRGFGETEGIGPDSPHLTRAEAQANLKRLVEDRYEWAIRALSVQFTQYEWDALCSFVWNLGAGIFTGELRASLQQRRWQEAADLMLQYDRAGGVVLAGLQRRREKEVALFLSQPPANPLSVLLPAERRLVNTYDEYIKHPHMHEHGLKVTREAMVHARKVIWLAAQHEIRHGKTPAEAWGFRDRGKRYALLMARTKGLG